MPPRPEPFSTRHSMPTSSSNRPSENRPTENRPIENLQSEISNLKSHLAFERFQSRHVGPDADECAAMLKVIGAPSLDALMDQAIPARIRRTTPLNLPEGLSEHQFLRELR